MWSCNLQHQGEPIDYHSTCLNSVWFSSLQNWAKVNWDYPFFQLQSNFVSLTSKCKTISSYCRYKKLLSSVDLTKDFFFSYTYPIMQSLQKNVSSDQDGGMPYDNIFVWNAYLTQAIRSRCNNTIWTIALVHGHFRQVCLLFLKYEPI